jgi:hypothetical protein
MLGVRPDFAKRTIRIRPSLPRGTNRLHVRRLRIGDGLLDIQVARSSQGYKVEIANTGTWQTLVETSAMQHA